VIVFRATFILGVHWTTSLGLLVLVLVSLVVNPDEQLESVSGGVAVLTGLTGPAVCPVQARARAGAFEVHDSHLVHGGAVAVPGSPKGRDEMLPLQGRTGSFSRCGQGGSTLPPDPVAVLDLGEMGLTARLAVPILKVPGFLSARGIRADAL
jgi:hypothetical protein